MGKFLYEEGDIEVGDSQCALCIHFITKDEICNLIGSIPTEIKTDDVTCPEFEYEEELI